MTASRSMTFKETFPTSAKMGAQLALTLGALWCSFVFLDLLISGGSISMLLTLIWVAYFGYRFSRNFETTVSVGDGVMTIERKSIIPFLSPPTETHILGARPNVELSSTAGWWVPKSLPFMPGDNAQSFTDLAVSNVDPKGGMDRIVVSRDRKPAQMLIQRREELRRLLEIDMPGPSTQGDSDLGFAL